MLLLCMFLVSIVYDICLIIVYCLPHCLRASEILQRLGHGKGVDWWSLGTLMFDMLTGTVSVLHCVTCVCYCLCHYVLCVCHCISHYVPCVSLCVIVFITMSPMCVIVFVIVFLSLSLCPLYVYHCICYCIFVSCLRL